MKSKAKAKESEVKKHKGMAGGGEPIKELTGEEEKILNIMGPSAITGHPNAPTSYNTYNLIMSVT